MLDDTDEFYEERFGDIRINPRTMKSEYFNGEVWTPFDEEMIHA